MIGRNGETFERPTGTVRGIVLSALLAGMLAGCGRAKPVNAEDAANAPTVSVVKVARQNLSTTLEIASEFEPFQEINVYAKVSGYVQTLNIDWGKHVRKGEVLAILEIPELEQQIQLDEAMVRRSGHELNRAHDELNRAQSAYSVAHLTYTRLADVQKSRPELVAQQDIDVAQGKEQEADAALSGAKAGLAAAEQAVVGSQASLDKDKAIFSYARITAPFDGVVTEMDAFTGSLLPAGTSSNKGDQALCRLSQNNLLRLVIPVPERAVSDIHIGQTVGVAITNPNKKFEGKIVRVSGQIDLDTRTMHTEVEVPNPTYELVPGMYATVELALHTVPNALTVAVQAVQASRGGRGIVLVVNKDNRIEQREVALGLQTANAVQILSGLRENDLVVFGEQGQYREGELVKPKPIEPSKVD